MQFALLVFASQQFYLPFHRHDALKQTQKEDMDMAAFDTTRTAYGTDSFVSRIGSLFASMTGTVAAWNDARVTRNALAQLSDRELEDIGLIRGDIDMVAENRVGF